MPLPLPPVWLRTRDNNNGFHFSKVVWDVRYELRQFLKEISIFPETGTASQEEFLTVFKYGRQAFAPGTPANVCREIIMSEKENDSQPVAETFRFDSARYCSWQVKIYFTDCISQF